MVEVKSSTSVKDYHLTDAAIQSWVAQQAKLPLTSVEIAHIDNSFVYPGGGDYQGLFHYADISEQIADMKAAVPDWIIAALPYPRYYIDFETISPGVPVWAGTRPYMQVPFQWSCHVETAKGVLTHCAFLADGQSDPRRPFAESLIDAVGIDGPIFVYNAPFERSRMQEARCLLP